MERTTRHHGAHPSREMRPDTVPPAGSPTPGEPPREQAAEQYRAISEVTSDWAYALHIEADGRTVADWTSSDIQQVSGYAPGELGPVDSWLRLLHPDDRPVMRAHLAALQAGRSDTVEYRIVTRSGETRWIRDYARPMRSEAGAVHVVGGVRDITMRRQAESDRARLLREVDQLNDRLERLVLAMRDALREPARELASVVADLERGDATRTDRPAAERDRVEAARLRGVEERLASLAEELGRLAPGANGGPGTD